MISVFFFWCVMRTPSLFLSLCFSFFHHLPASPDSDASLCRRGERPGRLIGYYSGAGLGSCRRFVSQLV